jgi:predicted nucleic acid-binding protein
VQDGSVELHVPALCDIEVTAGLRRVLLHRELSRERADDALLDYLDLPLTRHGHRSILGRILDLRSSFTAYDASYVALAESLDAALLTADGPLSRAVCSQTDLEVLPAPEPQI